LDHLCGGFALFISMIAGCVPILGTSQRAEGWRLHTYQVTGQATLVNHYLLLEKNA
jgi:hypothetical protein